jgi:hypothetical protein
MKRSQDDPRRIEALFNPHVGDKAWYAWLQLKGQWNAQVHLVVVPVRRRGRLTQALQVALNGYAKSKQKGGHWSSIGSR